MPSKSHGVASGSLTTNGACRRPSSFARYWTPHRRASGSRGGAPLRAAAHLVPSLLDAPEEVVRGEEDEPAAEVAIALDDVVRVRGHVLAVTGEDDEVVEPAQLVAARERLEIVVREDVGLPAGLLEPAEEREVVAPEAGRDAPVAVRPVEPHRREAARVPGVAPAVTVRVVEVVGLPGVRRKNRSDARLAGRRRAEHERREPHTPVGCLELCRVETGRPVARLHRDRARERALPAPVDRHGVTHRETGELVAPEVRVGPVPDAEERQRERRRVGLDAERHRLLRKVRTARERRLDAEHADDGSCRALGCGRAPPTVDASLAVLPEREPHDVRPDRRLRRRPPHELVRARAEDRVGRPAHVAPADAHPDGVELDARPPLELEEHLRAVAARDPWRDRDEHLSVARKPLRRSAHREESGSRRSSVTTERDAGDRTERGGDSRRSAKQAPPCEPRSHRPETVAVRPAHRPVGGPSPAAPDRMLVTTRLRRPGT